MTYNKNKLLKITYSKGCNEPPKMFSIDEVIATIEIGVPVKSITFGKIVVSGDKKLRDLIVRLLNEYSRTHLCRSNKKPVPRKYGKLDLPTPGSRKGHEHGKSQDNPKTTRNR